MRFCKSYKEGAVSLSKKSETAFLTKKEQKNRKDVDVPVSSVMRSSVE